MENRYQVQRGAETQLRQELTRAATGFDLDASPKLMEAYAHAINSILSLEDQGWAALKGVFQDRDVDGLTLSELKRISTHARERTQTNALLRRGLWLRSNYAFGRGYRYEFSGKGLDSIPPRFREIINNPMNQEVLFSPVAMKRNNRTLFNSGNFFALYGRKSKRFSRIPLHYIQDVITWDDDFETPKYYKRAVPVDNSLGTAPTRSEESEWVPTDIYVDAVGRAAIPATLTIGGITERVNRDAVIIDLRVNMDDGNLWGVPDVFAALPWAWAASEYLKDGSRMLKALASIAYQIKVKTENAHNRAAAQVNDRKVAGTAITSKDTEIAQVPRSNAIDLYTGRPLQSMVASALDVSVSTLTADTARGGSYASENVLTLPELLATLGRQEDFASFFRRVFRVIGIAEGGEINFARLEHDPIHRQISSVKLASDAGFISQLEGRAKSLELLDIQGDPNELPEPTEFTGAKSVDPDSSDGDFATNAAQGVSGTVGALSDGDNELRDEGD